MLATTRSLLKRLKLDQAYNRGGSGRDHSALNESHTYVFRNIFPSEVYAHNAPMRPPN